MSWLLLVFSLVTVWSLQLQTDHILDIVISLPKFKNFVSIAHFLLFSYNCTLSTPGLDYTRLFISLTAGLGINHSCLEPVSASVRLFLSLFEILYRWFSCQSFDSKSFLYSVKESFSFSTLKTCDSWTEGKRDSDHSVWNRARLKRFFLFHFQFPFLLCGFLVLHLFYLHLHSSNNPLRLNTNNKIPFFPFILIKDFFGFILMDLGYQRYFLVS